MQLYDLNQSQEQVILLWVYPQFQTFSDQNFAKLFLKVNLINITNDLLLSCKD